MELEERRGKGEEKKRGKSSGEGRGKECKEKIKEKGRGEERRGEGRPGREKRVLCSPNILPVLE